MHFCKVYSKQTDQFVRNLESEGYIVLDPNLVSQQLENILDDISLAMMNSLVTPGEKIEFNPQTVKEFVIRETGLEKGA